MSASDPEAGDTTPHELVDAVISVEGMRSPVDEEKVISALSALPGIRKQSISEGKLHLEYDPLFVTKAQIGEVIRRAGCGVGETECGLASAITDALHGEGPGENPGPV